MVYFSALKGALVPRGTRPTVGEAKRSLASPVESGLTHARESAFSRWGFFFYHKLLYYSCGNGCTFVQTQIVPYAREG